RQMLKLDEVGIGRPYVETLRLPAVVELVAAVLFGRTPDALQFSPPRDPQRTIIARAAPAAGAAEHGVVLVLHDITDLRRADQIRRDFVADVTPAAVERRQRFAVRIEPGAESVRADPAKLHDALRNLVANAVTYAPAQTTILVDARRVDHRVEISVSDRGPGIPEEDLS